MACNIVFFGMHRKICTLHDTFSYPTLCSKHPQPIALLSDQQGHTDVNIKCIFRFSGNRMWCLWAHMEGRGHTQFTQLKYMHMSAG